MCDSLTGKKSVPISSGLRRTSKIPPKIGRSPPQSGGCHTQLTPFPMSPQQLYAVTVTLAAAQVENIHY